MVAIKIKTIELNPYLYKKAKYLPSEENFGIADVRITKDDNEELNVGIQFIDGKYIPTKILMYYEQIHLNQLEYGDNREFARTITINLIDFKYFSSKGCEKTIKIKANEGDIQLEEIEMITIELPKFICYDYDAMTEGEQWIQYIKGCDERTLEKIKKENKYIKMLDEKAEKYWVEEKME